MCRKTDTYIPILSDVCSEIAGEPVILINYPQSVTCVLKGIYVLDGFP